MKENEVNVAVLLADSDALLPGLKAKAGAKFQEEGLAVIEQGFQGRVRWGQFPHRW